MFVNAQWALGGEGTGAPVHFHNTGRIEYTVLYSTYSMLIVNRSVHNHTIICYNTFNYIIYQIEY